MTLEDFLPPGWAIGAVWTVILALLGGANHIAVTRGDWLSFSLVCAIIASCIAYPFYTSGLSNQRIARYGNAGTMLLSYACYAVIACRSIAMAPFMLPLLGWSTYVTMVSFYVAGGGGA